MQLFAVEIDVKFVINQDAENKKEAQEKAISSLEMMWIQNSGMIDLKITSPKVGVVRNVVIQPDGVSQKQSSIT